VKVAYLENLKDELRKEGERVLSEGTEDGIEFVKGFISKIDNIDSSNYQKLDESIIACSELKQHLEEL
jgi:hypothetical protein